ncbi:uncharacterized protein [Leptinotarsa decemlineata]|uniref:uncharacterized protein n=1 Tax=Leptinotarsa decemlineata TaxID=7539 RepID=UPI003D309F70
MTFRHIGKNCPLSAAKGTKPYISSNELEKSDASTSKFAFSAIRRKEKKNEHHFSYLVNNKTSWDTWILDSGSTDHMTSNFEKFINFTKRNIVVEIASGKTILSTGFGDIEMKLDEENGGSVIVLKNVPELRTNLLSTSVATEKCLKIIFEENHSEIIAPSGELVAKSIKINGLFYMKEKNTNTKQHK